MQEMAADVKAQLRALNERIRLVQRTEPENLTRLQSLYWMRSNAVSTLQLMRRYAEK